MTENSFEKPPPPLCVWCSAPWTDQMMKVLVHADVSSGYYDSWEVDGADIKIDVTCATCNRLVYRKEIRQEGQEYL